jgi:transcriptional regulator with XRE-family HTH domain
MGRAVEAGGPLLRLGVMIRQWRKDRCLTQADLAEQLDISIRHMSFVEGGKSRLSREKILSLVDILSIPHAARALLMAEAGYLDASDGVDENESGNLPGELVNQLFLSYDPIPSYMLDAQLNVIASSSAAQDFIAKVEFSPVFFEEKFNLLLTLASDDGFKPFVYNWEEIMATLIWRLQKNHNANRRDGSYARLAAELRARVGSLERFNNVTGHKAERGINNLVLRLPGVGHAEFMHVMSDFYGPLRHGRSTRYRVETFFPADECAMKVLQLFLYGHRSVWAKPRYEFYFGECQDRSI